MVIFPFLVLIFYRKIYRYHLFQSASGYTISSVAQCSTENSFVIALTFKQRSIFFGQILSSIGLS